MCGSCRLTYSQGDSKLRANTTVNISLTPDDIAQLEKEGYISDRFGNRVNLWIPKEDMPKGKK